MMPQTKAGLFFWAWKQALLSARRPIIFLPLLVYAVLQLLLLAGLAFSMYPPFSFIFVPLQRALYGETALHYPNHFLVLPQLFDNLNIILSGVFGILVIGVTTMLFFSGSSQPSLPTSLRPVWQRYFHLIAAWFGETALILLVIVGFSWGASKTPAAGSYMGILRVIGVVGVSAIFAFTTVLILIERKPFWTALPQSVKMFARYALVTLLLVALPVVLQLPVQFILANATVVIRKLNPEVIIWVIATGVLISALSNYFVIGTVTHLYRAITTRR